MVGMMILTIKNKKMMQLGFDLLDFGPSESVRLLQALNMKSPLLIRKNFKHSMQSMRKSVSLEPQIKQGSRSSLPIVPAREERTCSNGQSYAA